MKKYLLTLLVIVAFVGLGFMVYKGGKKCYGYDNCKACKNCKYCKYCAKDGGKCGVCKKN